MSIRAASARIRGIVVLAALCLALPLSGCSWRSYVITRGIRHVTGARSRLHVIVPVASSLKGYGTIEVRPLANLLAGHVPPPKVRYLNDRIAHELGRLPSSPAIVRPAAAPAGDDNEGSADTAGLSLVVDGFLDDYDEGSLPLRIVELGFNHIAVTVRIRLRDQQSGRVVGAASVTAEDDRETGTTTAAINQVASRIRAFVEAGYAR